MRTFVFYFSLLINIAMNPVTILGKPKVKMQNIVKDSKVTEAQ